MKIATLRRFLHVSRERSIDFLAHEATLRVASHSCTDGRRPSRKPGVLIACLRFAYQGFSNSASSRYSSLYVSSGDIWHRIRPLSRGLFA
jgi:hypothetical protein